MLRSDLCDYRDAYIVVKGRITMKATMQIMKKIKIQPLRIVLHLDHAYQKSVTHL